jgi:MFS family permease
MITAFSSFNSYIYFSWFPKYLKVARQIPPTAAGLMASAVLGLAAVGTFAGGVLVDRIVLGGGGMVWKRRLGCAAFLGSAALLVGALLIPDPWLAAVFTALSCSAAQSTQPLWWSAAIGVSGRHVGALFGMMNSLGVFGAMSSQYLVGALADWMGARGFSGRSQWDPIFYIDVGVLVCAGLIWSSFRLVPVDRLDASNPKSIGSA